MKLYYLKQPINKEQLFKLGYRFVTNDDEIYMMKRTNDGNAFISKDMRVLSFKEDLIQELIDEGLVVLGE